MRVFVHTAAAAPRLLVEALADRAESLHDVEVSVGYRFTLTMLLCVP